MAMTLSIRSPAPPTTVLTLAPPRQWYRGAALLQNRISESIAIYNGGDPIALANFYPAAPKLREFTLLISKSAKPHMLALVRLAQLTIGQVVETGVTVQCRVRPGNLAGRRMAALVGFLPPDDPDDVLWIYEASDNGRTIWRRPGRRRPGRGSGEIPAPVAGGQ